MKPIKTWTVILLGVGIVFFVVGLFFLQGEQFAIYRLFSALIPAVFLICLLGFLSKKASKELIVFFILYAMSRFMSIFYEIDYMASLFLILNSFAFLSLVWYVAKSISFAKMNLFFKLIFVLVALINGYFVFQLIVIVNDGTLSDAHYINLLFIGICAIVLAFSALLYNHQHGSRASMFFLIAVLLIIFSQVFLTLGYYDMGYDEDISVYIARILLISSCIMFVRHNVQRTIRLEIS
jgi:hypothetical protein